MRPVVAPKALGPVFPELGCLGMQPKVGGKLHLRLNTDRRPIVKYCKGKLRTLKREFKRKNKERKNVHKCIQNRNV